MRWLFDLFRRKPKQTQDEPGRSGGYWTPETVEAAIERAGRDEVFRMAEQLGWSRSNPPPLWVWGQIAGRVDLERHKRGAEAMRLKGIMEYEAYAAEVDRRTLH